MSETVARALVADCLRLSLDQIPATGTMETIPGWDSLRHFEIITMIEKITKRQLEAHEIIGLKSVKDIAELIQK